MAAACLLFLVCGPWRECRPYPSARALMTVATSSHDAAPGENSESVQPSAHALPMNDRPDLCLMPVGESGHSGQRLVSAGTDSIPVNDPRRIPDFEALLDTATSDHHRTLAACGLACVGNAEACSVLIERSLSRDAAATNCRTALASVRSSYGQETLIQAATDPALPAEVRVSAMAALNRHKSERVRTVLRNLVQSTPAPTRPPQASQESPTVTPDIPMQPSDPIPLIESPNSETRF